MNELDVGQGRRGDSSMIPGVPPMTVSAACLAEERPAVGAIRWDAWTDGRVTEEVERSLGPCKYHDRLPWFAEVVDDATVRINGGQQRIMDQEIAFAADAGLDYWAFLLYPASDSMSQSLARYLASSQRRRIDFCLIIHNAFGVPDEQWPGERDRAVALLKEPGYRTVLEGRPLVYAFGVCHKGCFPAERFAEFRQATRDAGLNPYYVFMGWNPRDDYAREKDHGFDAVSAYAYGSADPTFRELVRAVESRYWKEAAEANVPYVPLVTTGWDKRPRKDHPVSWEIGDSYHTQAVFPATAEPHEIAAHLERALTFVRGNRSACEANAVIIYAWNEHDEGGWLAPTWVRDNAPNTARLDAVRKVLRTDTRNARPAAPVDTLPGKAERLCASPCRPR